MMYRIISLVFTGILLLACDPVGQSLDERKTIEGRTPTQESWNPVIRINSVGKENVQARAAYSAHYDSPREILFIGKVKLDFFNLEGEHSSIMTADTGNIDERKHLFTARGNVFLESDSGMTLSTSILYWHEDDESIYTDQPIVLTTLTDTLYGVGFESDANLQNWTIKQPTGVTYREFGND
ncbi:MAG: LPS export ABC transporter periplasmic protein LptC [Candidatus Marinimicrobia bacterium]|nr:LPS export ABC transporter periplasmic protein LptC [Candidatus Neomarinimicrobiota bacterium]MBT4361125.1 LPS export ABC transporter periplasmic protein LptC [Candidatus Neomarinimicrobiota bacterium]MBT4714769.1 LPS export ABC transporter periplasmic protein LptC [Candidatus Neomarinimicrobiota bacterium]MBT4947978.1 LPS export ABC transporter periplasmic protein LptC [Candidatus Neomarinimicrobiota bacterium]MBT5270766.1 LPS export ABC transporter periplasmic protein LptC [Candidatus Neom